MNSFWVDIDGDALHSSLGLPPAIHVTTAKVGKLEIVVCVFNELFDLSLFDEF